MLLFSDFYTYAFARNAFIVFELLFLILDFIYFVGLLGGVAFEGNLFNSAL